MEFICASVASVFSSIFYIVIAICVLLVMVLIHELGHYIVGRKLGFKITEFSIGFGKAIFQKTNKRGEKISLRIFPLGGYCAFEGEGEDDEDIKDKTSNDTENVSKTQEILNDISDIKQSKTDVVEVKEQQSQKPRDYLYFNEQKPWKRILVYLAGITFNFVSAFVFSFILLLSYGYDIQKISTIDAAKYQSINSEFSQQLQVGDVIWKVDGVEVNFASGNTLPALLNKAGADVAVTLTVKRGSETLNVQIKLIEETKVVDGKETKYLSTGFTTQAYAHSFIEALSRCFTVTFGFAFVVLKGFWQIISGQIALNQLGGPVSTIGMISQITQSGIANFLILLPLLASNLAIFNLFPLPALDGSHVIFTTIEWIRRKPIKRKVENYIHFFGLLALLAFVVIIDIIHLLS